MTKNIIKFTTDIAGNSLDIPIWTFGKGEPRVLIMGGTHGGEVTVWILQKLAVKLKKLGINGTVSIIPISNPISWNQRVYNYTVGKFSMQDGTDWNRGCPGALFSIRERRSKIIYELAKKYDYSIDLHTSRRSIPFGIFTKGTSTDMIKAVGIKYNLLLDVSADTSLMNILNKDTNTVGFEIECGSHDTFNYLDQEIVIESLSRFLTYVGVLKSNRNTIKEDVYTFDKLNTYWSDGSGFVEYITKPGIEVSKGDLIMRMTSLKNPLFGYKSVLAKRREMILKNLHTHAIWEGDQVVQTISKNNLIKL